MLINFSYHFLCLAIGTESVVAMILHSCQFNLFISLLSYFCEKYTIDISLYIYLHKLWERKKHSLKSSFNNHLPLRCIPFFYHLFPDNWSYVVWGVLVAIFSIFIFFKTVFSKMSHPIRVTAFDIIIKHLPHFQLRVFVIKRRFFITFI